MTFATLIFGFLLGLLTQFLLGNRRASEAAITDHISDIATLRQQSTEYWLAEPAEGSQDEMVDAAKVQVALAAVTAFEEVADRWIDADDIDEYQQSITILVGLVTGGEFETRNRKRSPETAIEISRECASLIHFLRGSRSTVYNPLPPAKRLLRECQEKVRSTLR